MLGMLPLMLIGGGVILAAAAVGPSEAKAGEKKLPTGKKPPPKSGTSWRTPRKPPKPPKKTPTTARSAPSADLISRMVRAIAAGDITDLKKVVRKLEAQGFSAQAKDAREAIGALQKLAWKRAAEARARMREIKEEGRSAGLPTPPRPRHPKPPRKLPRPPPAAAAPAPRPTPPEEISPPVRRQPAPNPPVAAVPPAPPPPVEVPPPPALNSRQRLAHRAHAMLSRATKGSEDRSLVKTYQAQEGLKASGIYGPGTGKSFIKYLLVPPKPFYWPRTGRAKSKKNYRDNLIYQSRQDPSRAAQWLAASQVT